MFIYEVMQLLDAFNSSDSSNVYNVLSGAATGKVMNWFSQTLNQWAKSVSAGEALYPICNQMLAA